MISRILDHGKKFVRVAVQSGPRLAIQMALGRLCALNESLGNPVDIRFDPQYDEMAALTAQAGVYLHTFVGMPISIAEPLACGAVAIGRHCPEARAYAGPDALYYNTLDEAPALLQEMRGWTDQQWNTRAAGRADFADAYYADDVVLPRILSDWQQIASLPAQCEV
jgi:hypothetical protein